MDRRSFFASTAALLVSSQAHAKRPPPPVPLAFPDSFLWGAATAGHQVEGNNVASDTWHLEHVRPSTYQEPSGDACNSFVLWREDLDLVRDLASTPIGMTFRRTRKSSAAVLEAIARRNTL